MGAWAPSGICLGSGGVVAGKGHGREYTEIKKIPMPSSLLRLSVETRGRRRVEAVEWTKVGCSKTKKRRHSLQCYAHGAHPAPAAPCGWAVRLILLRPTVSAFPIQSLGSPVQSSPDCPVLSAVLCCAVLRSALSLSPFPPRLPTFSFSTSASCLEQQTSPSPVAILHHPSVCLFAGTQMTRFSWSRLIRRRPVRSSPRPVSSSQPPRPSPSPAFEIRSAPYPR